MMYDRESIDEEAYQELFEGDLGAEDELDFSEDYLGEHEGGKIYESIEEEIDYAVSQAEAESDPSPEELIDDLDYGLDDQGFVEINIEDILLGPDNGQSN